ncbi:hypothetical protein FUAX_20010 [Fulvitalea axinellae]|uniref:DUF4293 family protein n=1 Tax=Fulvitalea axinellae TaxID=1182444 RepID=A0AAU9CBR8_9BACT|nr:hypothetical protein FUAX_20010 [Fulvitalea axinellae]
MLQRVQTLFLALAVALLGGGLYFPLWASYLKETGEAQALYFYGHEHIVAGSNPVMENMPFAVLGVLSVISILIGIYELVSFKNRMFQMKLGMGNTMLMLLNLGLSIYFVFTNGKDWTVGPDTMYRAGIFMLMGAVVCNQIATRFIKRDEELVRSVDRIR